MIILIRHASPLIDNNMCSNRVAQERMNQYNRTEQLKYEEIDPLLAELHTLILKKHQTLVYTSVLPRSINTAHYIFDPLEININCDPLFSEFDLNIIKFPFRLSTKKWFFISRIAWALGIKGNASSFFQEKTRSKMASKMLEKSHDPNTAVVLVSHAFMNRYIKKELEKNNWMLTTRKKNGCFEIQCLIQKNEGYKPLTFLHVLSILRAKI